MRDLSLKAGEKIKISVPKKKEKQDGEGNGSGSGSGGGNYLLTVQSFLPPVNA